MKKILIPLAVFFLVMGCATQQSQDDNTIVFKLSENQKSMYDSVLALCNSEETLYFADEEFAQDWAGHETELKAAKFITDLLRVNNSNQGDRRTVAVGHKFLDECLDSLGTEVPAAYPENYKAYAAFLDSVLKPVEDHMIGGSQLDMNQYSYADDDIQKFKGMLKNDLLRGSFKESNLKAALEKEASAWDRLREEIGGLFYNYRVKLNGGIGYSMLPLEVSGVTTKADQAREKSMEVLYAISKEGQDAVFPELEDGDCSDIVPKFLAAMEEEGVETAIFKEKLDAFLAAREEVKNLLSSSMADIYNKDTQRYIMLLPVVEHFGNEDWEAEQ